MTRVRKKVVQDAYVTVQYISQQKETAQKKQSSPQWSDLLRFIIWVFIHLSQVLALYLSRERLVS